MNYNLGYACINTKLRKKNIFSSRTCRLETFLNKGYDYVKNLAIKNLLDLKIILQHNVYEDIRFFRMSSEMFPFASHLKYRYSIDFAKDLLKEIGDYAKENNIRLTFHPGQYVVLSSDIPDIVENSINDLKLHADILDMMGLDKNSVMVIHGGGVYGNKNKALNTLKNNIKNLPSNIRDRLVLENCEMSYTVRDLLPISQELLVPIVVDFHHDEIHPGSKEISYYLDDVFKIWDIRGIKPKIHISNSVPGVLDTDSKTKRRKHGDLIYRLHPGMLSIKREVDVMIEAKHKELALYTTKELLNNLK